MYKIPVSELLEEVGSIKEIAEAITLEEESEDFVLTKPLKTKLSLISLKDSLLLKGSVLATVQVSCARCGKDFEQDLPINIEEVYKKESEILHFDDRDRELGAEDLCFVIEDDNTIDIEEVLRQNIIMALPIKPICSINCTPVQASFGELKKGNALSGLKDLLENKKGSENGCTKEKNK